MSRQKNRKNEISHDWIIKNIPIDKVVIQKWLKSGYIKRNKFYSTDKRYTSGLIKLLITRRHMKYIVDLWISLTPYPQFHNINNYKNLFFVVKF